MKILYIGTADVFGTKLINYMAKQYEVTAVTFYKPEYELCCRTRTFKNLSDILKADLSPVDAVVYLKDDNFSMEFQDEILQLAVRKHISDVYFIMPKQKKIGSESNLSVKDPDFYETDFTELLCRKYNKETTLHAREIIVPEIYDDGIAPEFLRGAYRQLRSRDVCCFKGEKEEIYDVIHIDDLCTLIVQLLKERTAVDTHKEVEAEAFSDSIVWAFGSGNSFQLEILMRLIAEKYPKAAVKCDGCPGESPISGQRLADWMPEHHFLAELDSLLVLLEDTEGRMSKEKTKKTVSAVRRISGFLILLILVAAYQILMPAASELQYVDVKIIFIVFAGLTYPDMYAILAAAASSILLIYQSAAGGTIGWRTIFCHVNNWIPFGIYLVTALVCILWRRKEQEKGTMS